MEVNKFPILGQVIKRIAITDDKQSIFFFMQNGDLWEMCHKQKGCEDVILDDIKGYLSHLYNYPLTQAEGIIREGKEPRTKFSNLEENEGLWSCYKFVTEKGCVIIKWFAKENLWNAQEVSFKLLGTLNR